MLVVRRDGIYVDGTAGSGGHSAAILEVLDERGRLICIDRDPLAVDRVRSRIGGDPRVTVVHGNHGDMDSLLEGVGVREVDGIVMDLGVSSEQLSSAERGFSFDTNGPLDMRMDSSGGRTAGEMLKSLSVEELADVIHRYGEDPRAKGIASEIVKAMRAGKLADTADLAGAVMRIYPHRGARHPATRTFQALRMYVNDEQGSLEKGLKAGVTKLRDRGRMAVISFHSLEDRMVKHFFLLHQGRWESQESGGTKWTGAMPRVRILTRKAVRPSAEELTGNRRARTARLRVAERCDSSIHKEQP